MFKTPNIEDSFTFRKFMDIKNKENIQKKILLSIEEKNDFMKENDISNTVIEDYNRKISRKISFI